MARGGRAAGRAASWLAGAIFGGCRDAGLRTDCQRLRTQWRGAVIAGALPYMVPLAAREPCAAHVHAPVAAQPLDRYATMRALMTPLISFIDCLSTGTPPGLREPSCNASSDDAPHQLH